MKRNRRHTPIVRPSVVFSPNLIDGIDAIADAVKSTLGPLPRLVGVERIDRSQMPELLDDAGVIARRIIQLEDETADVGAMMLRHGMWRMRERLGDGAATMAILTQAILREATKGIAAGMHPMGLRRGIEAGANQAVAELRRCARPLPPGKAGRTLLAALARTLSTDAELADAVVRVVNVIGSEGAVDIVINERRSIDVEFTEGAMWNTGWSSAAYVTDKARGLARQEDVSVVVFDGNIETAEQAFDGMRRLAEQGVLRVAIISNDIAEEALKVFAQVHRQGRMSFVLVKAPGTGDDRMTALQDISALTGARILFTVGEFTTLKPEDMGYARRMWSTAIKFGIIAGRRDGDVLRGRIEHVRRAIANFNDKKKSEELPKLRWRLAQLTGGLAVLQVGALTRPLADTRKETAERIIQVLQQATSEGLVAGGGTALLFSRAAVLQAAGQCTDPDEQYGMRCVAQALGTPLSAIVHNAGYEPKQVAAQVLQTGDGSGFDVCSGKFADMWDAGIVDSLPVIERAVQTAASVATMAVITTCVVHQKKHYPGVPTP
jgi:chaperonin GroEL